MNAKLYTKTAYLLIIILLVSGSGLMAQSSQEYMRANLYHIPSAGSRVLIDGNYTQYDDFYSNDVDMYDVWKMTNLGENFGIIRQGYTLVMERRKVIPVTDTTYFRLWNLQQKDYQIEIITKNCDHAGLAAFMRDNYTGTDYAIHTNDTSRINFTVTSNPASGAQDRFQLVYKTVFMSALPLNITSVIAQQKFNGIMVNWKTENESEVAHFNIERSGDGFNFISINQLPARNTGTSQMYTIQDASPFKGSNYYRIHAIDRDGKDHYSAVTKVRFSETLSNPITVFPNPVENRQLNVQFTAVNQGSYRISVVNTLGMELHAESVQSTVSGKQLISLPAGISKGMYHIIITGPRGYRQVEKVIVL